ncbi:MAG TPA: glycogen debranching enzyme, partial [Thermoanaerobaculia bacterium]|nr:glycogen debranching enzyme [Thermoanaerobaculia bacterium]
SYNDKHNEANGENNNDGANDNRSWNCGVEGASDRDDVNTLRSRQQRNFLTTLLLSIGVPMICGGDEIGRTQRGNNNAYCQDNNVSWFDWDEFDGALFAFVTRVVALRKDHPVFQRRRFFAGRPLHGDEVGDIGWFKPDGNQMTNDDWQNGYAKSLGVFLNGEAIPTPDSRGDAIVDDSFYLLFNAHYDAIGFKLPTGPWGERWARVIDTSHPIPDLRDRMEMGAGETVSVAAHSMMVLKRVA